MTERRYSVGGVVGLVLVVIWTFLAVQWHEVECPLVPDSYVLVVTHGTPSIFEGCGDGYAVDVRGD
ncbi:hypothetical protein ABZ719_08310 [Streptomyces sp. NPDC006743]|uniref:hypothetical protein n=1 Tax=Streptomyces sp. NPDC006743 TaxID=3154480 RepID=UPI003456CF4A